MFLALGLAAAGLVGPATAWAQRAAPNLRFQHLTNEDGLSLNLVWSMLQDRRGFMWFGTEDGLNRYDGYTFTVYEAIPFDSTSLVDDGVLALAEGPDGALWVGTGSGLSRLDPRTGRFRHYRHDPRDPASIPPGKVDALAVDSSGTVWVGMAANGLSRLDPRTERFRHYRHDPHDATSLSSDVVRALYHGSGGALWVGTTNGLNRLMPDGQVEGTFRRYLYDPGGLGPGETQFADSAPPGVRAGFIVSLCDDPAVRGVQWVWTGGGLVRLDARTGQVRLYTPPRLPRGIDSNHGPVGAAVLPDPDVPDVLWVASREGLYHFDARTGRFTSYRHDPDRPSSIAGEHLRGLLVDRTGLVWVQTNVEGIERFDPAGAAFVHERLVPEGGSQAGSVTSVRSLAEDAAGGVWFVPWAGLAHLDRKTGTYTHIEPRNSADPAGPVHHVYTDRAGALWLGRRGGVVDRIPLDGEGRVVGRRTRFTPADGVAPGAARAFYEDRAGTLWIGTGRGLSRLDAGGRSFTRVSLVASRGETEEPDVQAVFEDAAGIFWVGTATGLLRLDRASGIVTSYRHEPRDPTSLSAGTVQAIHERAREPGVLWIGHLGGGLSRLDARTGRVTHFTEADGLPNNTVYAILEDERGHLWMSTNQGVSRLDPEHRTFTNYGTDDGLQSREFNGGAAYRSTRTGELFFGGINGFNAFLPGRITRNPHPPAVVMIGLRIANHPVTVSADGPLRAPIEEAAEVRLGSSEKTVTFEFVGLHYQDPARNRYAYRLDGFDDTWVDAGTERTATYTNLDPGTYTFLVRAASGDGVWNEEGASIRLVVLPAWWQTLWARLAGVLALAGLVWGGYRWRTAQVRAHNEALRAEVAQQTHALAQQAETLAEANERLREVDRRRRAFFANVSHEFRTPLTLILGSLDDLRARLARTGGDGADREATREEAASALDVARHNARRLLRLIIQLLDAARLEAGAMRLAPRPGDLARVVREVGEAFAGVAERRGVAFRIVGADAPLEASFDVEAVEKVLGNLASNAFKFTPPGGTVELRLGRAERDGRALAAVAVRDSGPGIAEEALAHVFERFYRVDEAGGVGTGIGLALAKELAELHGGTVEVESAVGSGSVFTLFLPLDEAAPAAAPVGSGSAEPEGRAEAQAAAEVLEPDTADSHRTPGAVPDLPSLRVHGDGLLFDADLSAVAEEAAREAAEAEADRPLVLVADDNADMRAYVGRHLRPRYRVVEAADGREALQKAREHLPDLVLSDVMMPVLDGLALLRALKADPETDFVPVVLLTARAAVEDRLEGLHAEADDYLTKPFEVAELVARVENLIAGRRRLRARLAREAAPASGSPGVPGAPGAMPAGFPATTLHAAPVAVASADAAFLEQVRQAVEEHMGEAAFGVEALAEAVGVSRVHLFRRLRELCGEAPSALLMRMRLERAAALLAARAGTVSEVAYGVGFRSVSHFSRAFRARYGTTPSAYAGETHAA
ncbi:MAG TPA: two-component regulator propeller domain-containing protein [Rubricoccaceae bacterium]|nr:two-component regulator propeller domain-containing protein [Rubricoccaceae bacterium]